LNEGAFSFEESHDVWRLLAAMTFHKARNAVLFHQRHRRDVRRDLALHPDEDSAGGGDAFLAEAPQAEDLDLLFDCLEQLLTGLPDGYREIVVRRREGDWIREIARRVQRTRQTVSRVLSHLQERAARLRESAPCPSPASPLPRTTRRGCD